MNFARPVDGVELGIRGAREVIVTKKAERDDAFAGLSHPYGRIGQVIVGETEVTLLHDLAAYSFGRHLGPKDEVSDGATLRRHDPGRNSENPETLTV
jgi:hypothetical protein